MGYNLDQQDHVESTIPLVVAPANKTTQIPFGIPEAGK
jgi:hypothetical protein